MIIIEQLTPKLKVEYDFEILQITFYYCGNEFEEDYLVEQSTIEPTKSKLEQFLKSIDKLTN
jgi:hypothetical protein